MYLSGYCPMLFASHKVGSNEMNEKVICTLVGQAGPELFENHMFVVQGSPLVLR